VFYALVSFFDDTLVMRHRVPETLVGGNSRAGNIPTRPQLQAPPLDVRRAAAVVVAVAPQQHSGGFDSVIAPMAGFCLGANKKCFGIAALLCREIVPLPHFPRSYFDRQQQIPAVEGVIKMKMHYHVETISATVRLNVPQIDQAYLV